MVQHRTYTKNRPSTQNDSFLRHWRVYSNYGLDDVCINGEGVFGVKLVAGSKVALNLAKKKKKKTCLFLPQVARGRLVRTVLTNITFGTFTCWTTDEAEGSLQSSLFPSTTDY